MLLPTLVLFQALFSCSNNPQKIKLTCINKTEYNYNFSVSEIKKVIYTCFSKGQFYGLDLGSKENELITKIFNDPGCSNDFILEEFSTFNKCTSKVYKKNNGEFHVYHGTYHIHLDSIGPKNTRVKINVLNSGVVYKTLLPTLPHLQRVNKLEKTPPTTVEEYEILLIIGQELGVADKMPTLCIPDVVEL